MSGIFLLQDGGQLISLVETQYDSEAILQSLLVEYTDLLSGGDINPNQPRRWLLISREASVPCTEAGNGRWAVDHLFLDQDGIPTLVEVKRSCDTRIRREVVGQMLDYAANAVVYWPIEHLQTQFERTCVIRGVDTETELMNFLGPDGDPDQFWQVVKTNLQAGRVRLLFVADIIPDELRRVVEFLNEQMDPAEVLALEIRQFAGDRIRTLVPQLIGRTAEAEHRKSTGTTRPIRQWDEATFFAEITDRGLEREITVARQLLEWGNQETSRIWWGKGSVNGSFVPLLLHNGVEHMPFAVYTGGPKGRPTVEIYFYWYAHKLPFKDRELRIEMLRKLNSIPGISLPVTSIDKRPNIPLAALFEEDRIGGFLSIMNWYLERVRET